MCNEKSYSVLSACRSHCVQTQTDAQYGEIIMLLYINSCFAKTENICKWQIVRQIAKLSYQVLTRSSATADVTRVGGHCTIQRSFNVIDFSANKRPIIRHFIVVNNSN